MQYTSRPVQSRWITRATLPRRFFISPSATSAMRPASSYSMTKFANTFGPSTRPGQLARLFAGLEHAEPRARTDFAKPLRHFQNFLHRRGIAIVISDFYENPETIDPHCRAAALPRPRSGVCFTFSIRRRFDRSMKGSVDPRRSRNRSKDRSHSRIREDDVSRQDRRAH